MSSDRLDGLGELEAAALEGAMATHDEVVALGWSSTEAAELLATGYADWVCARVRHAIALAVTVLGADR